MTFEPVWAVEGGRADAASARRLAWAATSGASGVTLPLDLKVSAYAVPGAGVNIGVGGGVVESTYAGAGACESYQFANDATTQLSVPGGLPSVTTYYVIVRVDDFHYNQSPAPADPLTYNYVKPDVVTSGALSSVTDPYILLAKIVLPANTAAITNAMITDLRTVANPREQTVIRPITAVATDTNMNLVSADPTGEIFPGHGYDTIGPQVVSIPTWATKVQIQCTWLGLYYPNTNPFGRYWVEWGPSTGSNTRAISTDTFRFDAPQAGVSRAIWIAAAEQYIPASYRGTDQTFVPKARYDSDASHRGVFMDYMSGMVWTIRFLEVADDSNS